MKDKSGIPRTDQLKELAADRTEELKQKNEDHHDESIKGEKTEQNQRKSEEKYQKLFHYSSEAVILHDAAGNIFDVNQSGLELFGYSRSEMLSLNIVDLHPKYALETSDHAFERILKEGVICFEIDFRRKNGDIFPAEVSSSLFETDKDQLVQALLRDITRRNDTERELKYRVKMEELIANVSAKLVYVSSDKIDEAIHEALRMIGEFTSVDRSYIFLFSKDGKEMTNSHEWCAEGIESQIGNLQNVSSSRVPWWMEKLSQFQPIHIPSVADLPSEAQAEKEILLAQQIQSLIVVPLVSGNTLKGFLGFDAVTSKKSWPSEDITLLKIVGEIFVSALDRKNVEGSLHETEHKLRDIIEHSTNLFYSHTPDHQLTYVSPQSRTFFDCEPEEALVKWTEYITDNPINQQGFEITQRAIDTGEPQSPYQLELQGKKGKTVWVEVREAPVVKDGKTIAVVGSLTDITERKKAEEQLFLLAHAIKNISEGVSITDMEDTTLFVNDAFKKIYGYSEGELIGKPISMVRSEKNDPELIREILPVTLEGGWQGEIWNRRKDGTDFPISLSTSVVKDDNGKPIALIGVSKDITEWKRAEEALKESEEMFRSLADQSPNMIFINQQGQVVYANQKCESIMGYTREEICDSNFDFRALIAPESKELVDENFKKHLRGEEVTSYEYTIITREGKRIEAIIATRLINFRGKKAVLGIVTDISELKTTEQALRESEEKYRRFFEEDLTGDYISTPGGKLLFCNPAFARIFGYDSVEEIMNTDVVSLYKRPEDRENFLKQLKQKKKIEYNEMELRRRDGKPIHVICNVSGIFDDHGELMQIQGYLFDDTERKEMEKHFQQVQKMEAIGTLAGGIAHDFNNILAAIIGYAEITKDDLTPGSMPHRNLQSIYQAGIRAKELVQQILTFSRQTQHELKPIKMDLILREALKFLNASLPPSIRLRKTIEPDCRTILADPSQIHQLIMNLCTNAYQAIDEGGEGIIEVSLEPENLEAERQVNHYKLSPGEYVKFTVKDSGCGMDEATRKRIFDPFFTTKAVGKGTGLGLSVVHGIVEKLHGIIFVTSQPGQGSTFTVYLPGYDQSAPAEEQIDEAIPGGTEHILLVDDEQTFVAMEKQLLERLGYTVTTATHGFEALELFRITPNRFDLVMTDQLMPNMTGLELAEELLQIRPHLPIILMSGFSENISREQAQNMGLFDSISKPIVKRDMVVAVRNALDSVHQKEV